MTPDGADPFLLVGLGNPDRRYRDTRHNIGFLLLNHLAEDLGIRFRRRKFEALLSEGRFEQQRLLLAKPQTYMNLSGRSVAAIMRYYNIPAAQVLVVFDDLDLPLGVIRIREFGGSGGHKGLKSILDRLDHQDLPRMRVGIGRPPSHLDPADFVLQPFDRDELELVEITLRRAIECVRRFVLQGPEAAMTECNPRD